MFHRIGPRHPIAAVVRWENVVLVFSGEAVALRRLFERYSSACAGVCVIGWMAAVCFISTNRNGHLNMNRIRNRLDRRFLFIRFVRSFYAMHAHSELD